MSMRFTGEARRGMLVLTAAAALAVGAVGAVGCGGDGGNDEKPKASASASKHHGVQPSTHEGQEEQPLVELKGSGGLMLAITSAERDSGGFVTVSGVLKNDGDETVTVPAAVRGSEMEIRRHGMSLGGATLVDSRTKKRFYVLRDTDGRPLTTTGFSSLKAGESLSVFMQFPAPSPSTTEVSLQLPTFSSAAIKISG